MAGRKSDGGGGVFGLIIMFMIAALPFIGAALWWALRSTVTVLFYLYPILVCLSAVRWKGTGRPPPEPDYEKFSDWKSNLAAAEDSKETKEKARDQLLETGKGEKIHLTEKSDYSRFDQRSTRGCELNGQIDELEDFIDQLDKKISGIKGQMVCAEDELASKRKIWVRHHAMLLTLRWSVLIAICSFAICLVARPMTQNFMTKSESLLAWNPIPDFLPHATVAAVLVTYASLILVYPISSLFYRSKAI